MSFFAPLRATPRLPFLLASLVFGVGGCLWPGFDPDLLDGSSADSAQGSDSARSDAASDARSDAASDLGASEASPDAPADRLPNADGSLDSSDATAADAAPDGSAAPTLTGAMPGTVYATHPARVTLTGTGFDPGATVTIDGMSATVESRVGSTQLVITPPVLPTTSGFVNVVVTNAGGGSVSNMMLLTYRRATLSFTAQTPVATCASPQALVVDDLNGDTFGDVGVACQGAALGTNVAVHQGRAASLGPATTVFATRCSAITALDINGDGRRDLLTNDTATPALRVFTNSGTTFTISPTTISLPAVAQYLSTGDLNADRRTDVLFTMAGLSTTQLGYALAGATSLGAVQTASSLPLGSLGAPIAADLNADGHLDVVAADVGMSRAQVFLGNTAMGAALTAGRAVPLGVTPLASLAVGIFDQDNNLDLLAAASGIALGLSVGAGDGTFMTPRTGASGSTGNVTLLSADFDGDGATDVLLAGSTPTPHLVLLQGRGDGLPMMPTTLALPCAVTALAPGDIDGDGKLDAVGVCTATSQVVLLLNRSM